jgi:branched-chain amino acid transport system permease protein
MRIGDAVSTYAADEAMLRTRTQRLWMAALVLALAVFPAVASPYLLYLGVLIGIAVISATGLNLLAGYTGQISLGQGAFMGVGAYTAVRLAESWGLPLVVTLPAAGLVTAGVGVVVGLPSLRVKGLYLAIATMAASVILHFVFVHWEGATGGNAGINLTHADLLLGWTLDTDLRMYAVVTPLTVLAVAGQRNLLRTRVGRAFIAVRDRDISAEVLGVNLLKYKLMSFGISSFYAGCAGALWAYFFKVVTPESFPFEVSIFYLAAIIVGGMGTVLGPIVGAAFMTLVPELLRALTLVLEPVWANAQVHLSPLRGVVFGALIVGFLLFEPHGIAEIWSRIQRTFRLWPFKT